MFFFWKKKSFQKRKSTENGIEDEFKDMDDEVITERIMPDRIGRFDIIYEVTEVHTDQEL